MEVFHTHFSFHQLLFFSLALLQQLLLLISCLKLETEHESGKLLFLLTPTYKSSSLLYLRRNRSNPQGRVNIQKTGHLHPFFQEPVEFSQGFQCSQGFKHIPIITNLLGYKFFKIGACIKKVAKSGKSPKGRGGMLQLRKK